MFLDKVCIIEFKSRTTRRKWSSVLCHSKTGCRYKQVVTKYVLATFLHCLGKRDEGAVSNLPVHSILQIECEEYYVKTNSLMACYFSFSRLDFSSVLGSLSSLLRSNVCLVYFYSVPFRKIDWKLLSLQH